MLYQNCTFSTPRHGHVRGLDHISDKVKLHELMGIVRFSDRVHSLIIRRRLRHVVLSLF